ncbi:MAG: DUF929 family protein [Nitrososphaerota archaeon]|nr:DUF929 family protein [Nitrososphaerota archaeon]MDG7049306.1 DUF929 family protein [Nitrososphaerota archaeon]MDG7052160.1 DUF929 family protein [Nitrososphaerota archaeon]
MQKQRNGKKNNNNLVVGVAIIAVILLSAGGYITYQNTVSSHVSEINGELRSLSPVSSAGLAGNLTSVNGILWSVNGKPVVFFVGGEFCPFCAAESWPVAAFLSHYGSFTRVDFITSSEGSISAISFYGTSYTSPSIYFIGLEIAGQNRQPLQGMIPYEQLIFNEYDPQHTVPFLDIANQYVLIGSQVPPSLLSGMSQQQILAAIGSNSTLSSYMGNAEYYISQAYNESLAE